MLIPVNISNSVLAVPAPTTGTVRCPVVYSSVNLRKFGMGSSEKFKNSTSVGSIKDSNNTTTILGLSVFVVVSCLDSFFASATDSWE